MLLSKAFLIKWIQSVRLQSDVPKVIGQSMANQGKAAAGKTRFCPLCLHRDAAYRNRNAWLLRQRR